MNDVSLPIGTVTSSTNSTGSSLVSTTFNGRTLPAPPFALQFLSGNNSKPVGNATSAPVFVVSNYNPGTGNFTINGTFDSKTGNFSANATLQPMSTTDQFQLGAFSQRLSSFPISGSIASPLSGNTQNIYAVTLDNFQSGVVYVSYGKPLSYVGATAPSFTNTNTVFQMAEVTANPGATTTSDLTYIDYYGFPLQIESIDNTSNSTVDRRTWPGFKT